ncbi:MAG: chlorinating enzyme [Myxococcota bacterium]
MSADYFLSEQEREQFRAQGYLGPYTLLEPEQMRILWSQVLRRSLQSTETSIYPENKHQFDRHLDIPVLRKLVARPQIVQRLQGVLGDDVLCWRSSWFPKNPGDEGTDWHQTEVFAEFEGSAKLVPVEEHDNPFELTAWVAVTDATRENGCVQFIPGTHRQPWRYDDLKQLNFRPDEINKLTKDGIKRGFYGYDASARKLDPHWRPDESQAVYMELKAGQFFFFTSRCIHASLPNTSRDQLRLGLAIRYCSGDVRVYPDRDHWTFGGARFPLDRYRSMLVAGEDRYHHNKLWTES